MAYEFESHRPHGFSLRHPICGSSSVGRAPPCQGGGRESEPRLPLHFLRGCSSMAELQPSKLATRVRFPSPAPSAIHRTRGFAVVAQLVERHLAKVEVASPSLVYRSTKSRHWTALFSFIQIAPPDAYVRRGVAVYIRACIQASTCCAASAEVRCVMSRVSKWTSARASWVRKYSL